MWAQIGGACMAVPLGGCLVGDVNEIVVLVCCQEIRCPQLTTSWTEGIILWRVNLATSLVAALPQSQEQKNACCCRQNIENVSRFQNLGQFYASDIFISHVKLSRADYNFCWNVLRSVAYSKSCTFRSKGEIFPGSTQSVLTTGSKRAFIYPSPGAKEVCELLSKGMVPGGRLTLSNFHSFPPGGSEQWWTGGSQ